MLLLAFESGGRSNVQTRLSILLDMYIPEDVLKVFGLAYLLACAVRKARGKMPATVAQ
jgi:hypothetical protein